MLRCTAVADRITGDSNSVEPPVGHVLIPACFPATSRPTAPPRRHAPSPSRRALATALPVPPLVRRHRIPHTSTTTHARRAPHFRRLWPWPTILRRDPGLVASPPVRYTLREARREFSLPSSFAARRDRPPCREAVARRRVRICVTGPGGYPIGPSDATTGAAAQPEVAEVLFLGGGPGRRARTTSPGGRRTTRALGTSRSPPPRCMKSRAASLKNASADGSQPGRAAWPGPPRRKLAAPPPYPWLPPVSPQPTSNGPTTATCSLTPDTNPPTYAIDHILVREISWVVSALPQSLALRRRRTLRHSRAPPAAASQRATRPPHSRDQVRGQQPRLLLPLQHQGVFLARILERSRQGEARGRSEESVRPLSRSTLSRCPRG